MGATREKQPSKRSLKIQEKAKTTVKLSALDISTDQAGSVSTGSAASCLSSASSLLISDRSWSTPITSVPDTFTENEPTEVIPYDLSLVTIKETAEKGLGLFAVRRIREGTLVLAELPIIRFTAQEEAIDAKVDQYLRERYDELPHHLRKTYLQLHNAKKTGFSKLKSIYFSNCYNLEAPRSTHGGSCLAPIASRINHSCISNVQFSFAEEVPQGLLPDFDLEDTTINARTSATSTSKQGVMLFYALKDIPAGREVVSNYESAYFLAADRKLKQQMYYGFTCDCHGCRPEIANQHWALSDDRRKAMALCKRRIEKAEVEWNNAGRWLSPTVVHSDQERAKKLKDASKEDVTVVLATLERLADLLIREGLKGVELANTYKELAKWSQRAGNLDDAKRWCIHERSTCVTAYGEWSRRVKEVNERRRELDRIQLVAT